MHTPLGNPAVPGDPEARRPNPRVGFRAYLVEVSLELETDSPGYRFVVESSGEFFPCAVFQSWDMSFNQFPVDCFLESFLDVVWFIIFTSAGDHDVDFVRMDTPFFLFEFGVQEVVVECGFVPG